VFVDRETMGWRAVVTDASGPVSGAQVTTLVHAASGAPITERQGFTDASGVASFTWRIPRRQAPGAYTVTVSNVIHGSYTYGPPTAIEATFTIQ
jgi:hypothetical protein